MDFYMARSKKMLNGAALGNKTLPEGLKSLRFKFDRSIDRSIDPIGESRKLLFLEFTDIQDI